MYLQDMMESKCVVPQSGGTVAGHMTVPPGHDGEQNLSFPNFMFPKVAVQWQGTGMYLQDMMDSKCVFSKKLCFPKVVVQWQDTGTHLQDMMERQFVSPQMDMAPCQSGMCSHDVPCILDEQLLQGVPSSLVVLSETVQHVPTVLYGSAASSTPGVALEKGRSQLFSWLTL